MQFKIAFLGLLGLLAIVGCNSSIEPQNESDSAIENKRPNILLIVADDVGYSDLGAFGGEISTPNLDQLAQSGVQLVNFYVAPNCSPTRSMLLSGTDNHIAGLGTMAESLTEQYKGISGYEGYLNFSVATLPELLLDAGYHTYMAGKWHLGTKREHSPAARGFEDSFALLPGGASHFNSVGYSMNSQVARYRDGYEVVEELPDEFYSTRFYTQRMIEYIDSNYADGKPFFGYLAYTAPHWPLMAPDESVEKYKGRYAEGYRAIQGERLVRMKELGLIAKNEYVGVKLPKVWAELSEEERNSEARAMEVYAAMIDDMDRYVGVLVKHLESIGAMENTLIIFMSDNGAEGHDFSNLPAIADWAAQCCDNSFENMGRVNSYVWYGPGWGTVSSTPLGGYKGFPTQGGIRAPAIIVHPDVPGKRLNRESLTVMDIMPTVLEIAGVEHPAPNYNGRAVVEMRGVSAWSMLTGEEERVHPDDYVIARELFGKRSVQQGDWSIVSLGKPFDDGQWKLYKLENDISQSRDLSTVEPDVLAELIRYWEQYQQDSNVIMPVNQAAY